MTGIISIKIKGHIWRLHKGEGPRKVAVRVDVGIITIKKWGKAIKKSRRSTYSKGFTNCLISHSNLSPNGR